MPDPRTAVFDRLAPLWDEQFTPPDACVRVAQVAAAGRIRPGDVILDVGSGTGVLIPALLAYQPSRVIAADFSCEMLNRLVRKYSASQVAPLLAEAVRLPLASSTCQVIFCNGVWPHFEQPRVVACELRRVAAPGARLVIGHVIGRQQLNAVHAAASDPILHGDALPPAHELAALLAETGWAVVELEDTAESYRVVARR